jgi:peptide/nickel transport system ATP-binding protein
MTAFAETPIRSDAARPLLNVEDLAVDVSTRGGSARIVDGISFTVGRGEAVGVVGESGCGKSITMLSVMRLLPQAARVGAGRALYEGTDLLALPDKALRTIRGGKIGMIFQDPMTSLNPVLRIGEQLMEPLLYHRNASRTQARERAAELMRLVGIPGGERRLDEYPHQLSGGMRQRVMIAMGLACNPNLLIADEPTTALDVTIQAQIVDLVKDLRARLGMAIVWITHDLALVSGLVDKVLVLYSGRIVEEAPVDALYAHPAHPYTLGLLGSLPTISGPLTRRLPSIGGAPPDPAHRPPGCPFAPRCQFRIDRCTHEQPALRSVPGAPPAHRVACWVDVPQGGTA